MQDRKRDTDVQNRLLDSVGEGKGGTFRENSTETSILSRVKQITSPGWMHETSAQGWCTGETQRDGVGGRQEGGSGWGTHVNPWLIHVNVWQKPLQYGKVISLQLIKINEKKNSLAIRAPEQGFQGPSKESLRTGQAYYRSKSKKDNQPSFFTQQFGNFIWKVGFCFEEWCSQIKG